jgi:adenosylmethionine-8-amino-7-oxononanoate aminotransferase
MYYLPINHSLSIFKRGHPLSMAAGISAMDVFTEQKLFERAHDLAPYWEELLQPSYREKCDRYY